MVVGEASGGYRADQRGNGFDYPASVVVVVPGGRVAVVADTVVEIHSEERELGAAIAVGVTVRRDRRRIGDSKRANQPIVSDAAGEVI